MKKAMVILSGLMLLLLVACETGVPRYAPATGSYVKNGGTNRFSFSGGGNITIETPDGGFVYDVMEGDTTEDAPDSDGF